MVSSVLVGVGITLGGLVLSFYYDLPSGPAIILLGAALLAVVFAVKKLTGEAPRLLPMFRRR
jgi:ABC-type Mn2+/Zn2+ transport system permease subunit